ncbi:MAG TPA: sugar ABC transporter substrate-binding protein, partial [Thalassospira sp.]|nr:sugar ABC transporter substrate-binding protein [Thalassospira sp.]
VVILTNYARYSVLPSGHINSGPGFITKDNIAQVEKYAGEYR